jgi:tight adherence protein B
MTLLLVLVFIIVFAVFALIMVLGSSGEVREAKQTLAVLEAALATEKTARPDQIVDIRKTELFSAIPWINGMLLKMEIAPKLRSLLYQANMKWTVGTFLAISGVACLVPGYAVYWKTNALIVSIAVGLVVGMVPLMFVRMKRARRFSKFEQELPEASDLIVNALRAGHSLVSALGLVANEAAEPVGQEFRLCFEEQNYGLELRTAMANLVARVPIQDLRIVVAAILIQKESGGNLAEVLEKTSEVIRERFRLKRQVQVHTAQGRMTGWILTFLPLVLGIGLYLIAPDNISLLWKRDIGVKLLYASVIMTITGGFIIQKIVNIDI